MMLVVGIDNGHNRETPVMETHSFERYGSFKAKTTMLQSHNLLRILSPDTIASSNRGSGYVYVMLLQFLSLGPNICKPESRHCHVARELHTLVVTAPMTYNNHYWF